MIKRWALFFLLFFAFTAVLFSQPYRCDWQVTGIAGGEVGGGNYRCGTTVGQTASGLMSGNNLLALIGFWQADVVVGIQEREEMAVAGERLVTRLLPVYPNPFSSGVLLRYSLGNDVLVSLRLYDRLGRLVRVLVDSRQKAGVYSVVWDGCDGGGRRLSAGVYFCRFSAGEYQRSEKVILGR